MASVLRYLVYAAGGVLVLLLLVAVAVLLLVDPNDYRDDIAAAAREATGRELAIEGELGLGVLPCCRLQLGRTSLGNPAGWEQAEFLSFDNAEISVQLLPLLLRQEIVVGQVALDGFRLNLISRRDGSVNWEFPSESDAAADSGESGVGGSFSIAGVRVSDAAVSYADLAAGDRLEVRQLNLAGGPLASGEPLRLDMSARLDESNVQGWLQLDNIETTPSAVFDISVDALNADRYMAADDDAAGGDAAGADEPLEIPSATLRVLDVEGSLRIGELVFEGARLSDVVVTVAADDGNIRLHPLQAQLYGGSYAGDVNLDVRGNLPRLAVSEQLTGVSIGALLADMSETSNIAGIGNVSIRATARGNTADALLEQLKGSASFELDDGTYLGTDLWHEIRTARARLRDKPLPAAPENPQTQLTEFGGTVDFDSGTLRSEDFTAKLPFMRLTGSGVVNILDSTLDYTLRARVVETPVFDGGEELDNLTGKTLPVRLTGSFDSPRVTIDVGELAQDLAEDKLREKQAEVEDRLRKKLREKLGGDEQATTEGELQDDSSSDDPKEQLKQQLRGLFD